MGMTDDLPAAIRDMVLSSDLPQEARHDAVQQAHAHCRAAGGDRHCLCWGIEELGPTIGSWTARREKKDPVSFLIEQAARAAENIDRWRRKLPPLPPPLRFTHTLSITIMHQVDGTCTLLHL